MPEPTAAIPPTPAAQTGAAAPTAEERHASWAELFFDLVAVAGIGMLAHVLHHPTITTLALFALGFGAFWLCWTAFTLYGNAAGARTHTKRLLQGMFGMAVMAASVPGLADSLTHAEGEAHRSIQSVAFAAAYALARLRAAGSWRPGELIREWPVAQQVAGVLPWIASIWAPVNWTLWLWGVGLAIDVLVIAFISGDDVVEHAQDRVARARERAPERARSMSLTTVLFESGHLAERLSLFVIIVLGEGIIQSINAAAESTWDWALFGAATASFVLLVGLWMLSVMHGHAGVPLLRPDQLPRRAELAFHSVTTAALVIIAAGLGLVVGEGHSVPEASTRWLLCGGVALYFGLGAIASALARRLTVSRLAIWLISGVAVPLALAVAGGGIVGVALAWYVALVVILHARLGIAPRRPATPAPPA